tara:strand:+ start:264 stop:629 length:366 start_codon:yes stop_codon:yes gene_type:complete
MNPVTNITRTHITRRPWTASEDQQLVSLVLRDIDYAAIGKHLERTISAVANRAIKLGYSKAALKRVKSELLSAPKKRKQRKSTSVKLPSVAPVLQTKIRNYRIIVSALAITQAATLAMLTI